MGGEGEDRGPEKKVSCDEKENADQEHPILPATRKGSDKKGKIKKYESLRNVVLLRRIKLCYKRPSGKQGKDRDLSGREKKNSPCSGSPCQGQIQRGE